MKLDLSFESKSILNLDLTSNNFSLRFVYEKSCCMHTPLKYENSKLCIIFFLDLCMKKLNIYTCIWNMKNFQIHASELCILILFSFIFYFLKSPFHRECLTAWIFPNEHILFLRWSLVQISVHAGIDILFSINDTFIRYK